MVIKRSSLLTLQGVYYALTGIWSIIDIESFSQFTGYHGDYFLKHTNGILFTSLGILFIVFSQRKFYQSWMLLLGAFTALGISLVDLYYLPKIGYPLSFWVDFLIESGFFFGLIFVLVFNRMRKSE